MLKISKNLNDLSIDYSFGVQKKLLSIIGLTGCQKSFIISFALIVISLFNSIFDILKTKNEVLKIESISNLIIVLLNLFKLTIIKFKSKNLKIIFNDLMNYYEKLNYLSEREKKLLFKQANKSKRLFLYMINFLLLPSIGKKIFLHNLGQKSPFSTLWRRLFCPLYAKLCFKSRDKI